MRLVYFDYNATTPLDPETRQAMSPCLEANFGNPSSVHRIGRMARAALDDARDRVAGVFGCEPGEIVFTSGGTESNNLALLGTARALKDKGRHIITSPIEHHAVLHPLQYLQEREEFEVSHVPVDESGRISAQSVEDLIRLDTILVSIMSANNETGVLQPVGEIGSLCQRRGVVFHTDAVQWFGKEPFASIHQFSADLVSICAHKLHGPKGVGALFVRSPLRPDPILFGGGHEHERRAGTENLAAIVGFTNVVERFLREPAFPSDKLRSLSLSLAEAALAIDGVVLRSCSRSGLNNTVAFTVEGCDSIALLAGLDLAGVCASSGSACSAGSVEPSHVLLAQGLPRNLASSFVRFSLGRESTAEEVHRVSSLLPSVIDRIRRSR